MITTVNCMSDRLLSVGRELGSLETSDATGECVDGLNAPPELVGSRELRSAPAHGVGSRLDLLMGEAESASAPNFRNRTVWTGENLDILRGINSECVRSDARGNDLTGFVIPITEAIMEESNFFNLFGDEQMQLEEYPQTAAGGVDSETLQARFPNLPPNAKRLARVRDQGLQETLT